VTAPADTTERGPTRTWRLVAAWVLALGTLIGAAVLAGPPGAAEPLDPTSAAPDGLLGVVELLGELDVQVDVSTEPPVDTSTRLLVTQDLLPSSRRDAVEAWVEDGGTLVVTDPTSPLHGLTPVAAPLSDLAGATTRAPDCDLDALTEVAGVTHGDWIAFAPDERPDGAIGCVEVEGSGHWLVAAPRGDGAVVALGSPSVLTNRHLDRDDNAVLAAALLGPDAGAALRILARPEVGEGDTELLDLVPPVVWGALGLLVLAAVVAAVARGRRLGAPVAERLPPVLPGAELVTSVGELLQRVGDRGAAAARLRAGVRTEAARHLGVSTATPPATLRDLVIERTGVDPATAHHALVDAEVGDDDALLAVAAEAATVRRALKGGFAVDADPGGDADADPGGDADGTPGAGARPPDRRGPSAAGDAAPTAADPGTDRADQNPTSRRSDTSMEP
jgi:hypothetical protein